MNDVNKSEVSKQDAKKIAGNGDFLVVGIGASAGGIKALKNFFSKVPADSGMAYVVILHLSPNHDSQLAEILQHSAALPIKQVNRRVKVKPNRVYVIPPNKSLAMKDGHLSVSEINRVEERRAPVDVFFRTLAESRDSAAVSVVLSGTGANGSMGMKRVKEKGGICFVQDPTEAEYSDMPLNSIATGLVDYILPVAEIPPKIIAYKENLGQVHIPLEPLSRAEDDEQALREIFTLLRVRTGHDFSNYKRATVLRRITRRINVFQLTDLPSYVAYFRKNKEETSALLKDLLISVTNFYRDCESFEMLEKNVIPQLFEGKGSGDQVRVWIPGCATGEEAYSIAMLLTECAERLNSASRIQVFATDLDEDAITRARDGFYTLNDAADVSPERLDRFFIKEKKGYKVRRELREIVLFAVHNALKDPPFSRLDLVSCRNLLIYLNQIAQQKLIQIFHFALNPGCFLFLGSSESNEDANNLFVLIDKEHNIFQSRAVETQLPFPISDLPLSIPNRPALSVALQELKQEAHAHERLSYAEIHQKLLEQYAPPSIVVNEDYEILHVSPNAGRFMKIGGGEPSYELLKMVLPELRLELRTTLYQATQRGVSVESNPAAVLIEGQTKFVSVVARPVFNHDNTTRGFILVLFNDINEAVQALENQKIEKNAEPVAHQLEDELIHVKAQLRATIEQYEVQNEELKASNEELQAINEELHSSAEELETGKEELQSVNEELTTVNQELKIKIEELNQANNDFQNLMNSTDIGTIFLDRDLRVKMFTPSARRIFNLIKSDIGRPLSDISSRLNERLLLSNVENVIGTLQPVETEVETADDNWFLMRILPYRTSEDRISGVVITFLDVTKRKTAEQNLRRSDENLRLLMENARDYAIIFTNLDGIVESWNAGAENIFGYTGKEIIGKSSELIFTPSDRRKNELEKEMNGARATGRAADERWHLRKDGSRVFVSGVLAPLKDKGVLIGYVKIARDLTERIQSETALQKARESLEVKVVERTTELANVNESLQGEITQREEIEKNRRKLLKQLVTTQEDERQRLSRELHDQLGQQLTLLRLKLESLKEDCGDYEELCGEIEKTQEIVSKLDENVDFLAWELRPASLNDLGLTATLDNYVKEWSAHFNIPADFHSARLNKVRFEPEVEINLYRIAQEALNNINKYARADNVEVLLEKRDGHAVLIIEDDGIGFQIKTADNKGLGLIGIGERAALIGGTMEIESKTGRGTTIFVRVPLEPNP